jgi:hypothetical protein
MALKRLIGGSFDATEDSSGGYEAAAVLADNN